MLQRLRLEKKLEVHQGCVNTVAWNRLILLILSDIDSHDDHTTDDCDKSMIVSKGAELFS